jgi:hypothetical protein
MAYKAVSTSSVCNHSEHEHEIVEKIFKTDFKFLIGKKTVEYAKVTCDGCNDTFIAEKYTDLFGGSEWKAFDIASCEHKYFDPEIKEISEHNSGGSCTNIPIFTVFRGFTIANPFIENKQNIKKWQRGKTTCKICKKEIFVTNSYTEEYKYYDRRIYAGWIPEKEKNKVVSI